MIIFFTESFIKLIFLLIEYVSSSFNNAFPYPFPKKSFLTPIEIIEVYNLSSTKLSSTFLFEKVF